MRLRHPAMKNEEAKIWRKFWNNKQLAAAVAMRYQVLEQQSQMFERLAQNRAQRINQVKLPIIKLLRFNGNIEE